MTLKSVQPHPATWRSGVNARQPNFDHLQIKLKDKCKGRQVLGISGTNGLSFELCLTRAVGEVNITVKAREKTCSEVLLSFPISTGAF